MNHHTIRPMAHAALRATLAAPVCALVLALAAASASGQSLDKGGYGGIGGGVYIVDPTNPINPFDVFPQGGAPGQSGAPGVTNFGGTGAGGGGSAAPGGVGGSGGGAGGVAGISNADPLSGNGGGGAGQNAATNTAQPGGGGGGGGGDAYAGADLTALSVNLSRIGGNGGPGGTGDIANSDLGGGGGGGGGGAGVRWSASANFTLELNNFKLTGGGGGLAAAENYLYSPIDYRYGISFPASGGNGGDGFVSNAAVQLKVSNTSALNGGYGGGAGSLSTLSSFAANGNFGGDGDSGHLCGAGGPGSPGVASGTQSAVGGLGGNGIGLPASSTLQMLAGTTASGGAGGSSAVGAGGGFGGNGARGGNGPDGSDFVINDNACRGGDGGAGAAGITAANAATGGAGAVLGQGVLADNYAHAPGGLLGGVGGHGGNGSSGGGGGNGGNGGVGGLIQPAIVSTGRGLGGNGGNGGNGGDGGGGGNGGDGGAGALLDVQAQLNNHTLSRLQGGDGGVGGNPGTGASGGAGGNGGDGGQPGTGLGDGVAGTAGAAGGPGGHGSSGNGGPAAIAYHGSILSNDGFINGGNGGAPVDGGTNPGLGNGGNGGAGVVGAGVSIINTFIIDAGTATRTGTSGSSASSGGRGGNGGVGIQASIASYVNGSGATVTVPSTLVNTGSVAGSAGADGVGGDGGGAHIAGDGGSGIVLDGGSLNQGTGAAFTGAVQGGLGGAGGSGKTDLSQSTVGGAGGNGADALLLSSAATLQDQGYTVATGGAGGNGGDGGPTNPRGGVFGGGYGGAGGRALTLAGATTAITQGTSSYRGGNGGNGGGCPSVIVGMPNYHPANAGAGGAAIQVSGAGSILTHQAGTTVGGSGGTVKLASNDNATPCGNPGPGGSGIVANGSASVIFGGAATGGFKGGSSAEADRAPAIALHNGGNTLELRTGFSLTGNAVSDSGSANGGDVLILGLGIPSFDLNLLGDATQFRGFHELRKSIGGTTTLTGSSPFSYPTTVTASTLEVNGSLASSAVTVNAVAGSQLFGSGSVGALVNAHTVFPGRRTATGTLSAASYTQQATGKLSITVLSAASYSKLAVSGAASLAGTLSVNFGTAPSAGQTYAVLSASSLSGTFSNVTLTGAGALVAQVDYGVTTANTVTLTVNNPSYTIGGSVSGLTASGLVMAVTAGNQTANVGSGASSYQFPTAQPTGTGYTVSVQTQPAGQTCLVANASGTINSTNVINANVTCTTNTHYSVDGNVAGAAGSVQLKLDSTNPASTQTQTFSNGGFSFGTPLLAGSGWSVTVTAPPSGQVCSVSNGSGSNLSGTVGNVAVNCANAYTVTAAAPGGHGTITPASQTVASGSTPSFTVVPNAGFEVKSVTGDTCTLTQQGTTSTWTSSAITQACAVTAVFADFPSQCGGAVNYAPTFFDDFSGSVLDPAKWTVHAHGGNLMMAGNSVAVSAGSGFPYVASAGSSIPPTGDFSVRWIATYGTQVSSGTGSLGLIDVLPADGASSFSDTADAWQDGSGYRVQVRNDATSGVANAYSQQPAAQMQHDVEYCWLAGTTEVWVDGVRQMQAARNANMPRPAALWFGNPGATGAGQWQPFTLYYVEVRALNDRIFANGFEMP